MRNKLYGLALIGLAIFSVGCGKVDLGEVQVVYKPTPNGLDNAKLRGPGEFSTTEPLERDLYFPTRIVYYTFSNNPEVGNLAKEAFPIRIEGSTAELNFTASFVTNVNTDEKLSHTSNKPLLEYIKAYAGMPLEKFIVSEQFKTLVTKQANIILAEMDLTQEQVVTDSLKVDEFFTRLSERVNKELPAFTVSITPSTSSEGVAINLPDDVEERYRQAAKDQAGATLAEKEKLRVKAENEVITERAKGEASHLKALKDAGVLEEYIQLEMIEALSEEGHTIILNQGGSNLPTVFDIEPN